MHTCESCGESHAFRMVADGDLERAYDYKAEWQGVRLLCPHCGAVEEVSFGRVALSNDRPAWAPPGWRLQAVISGDAEIVPFPASPR